MNSTGQGELSPRYDSDEEDSESDFDPEEIEKELQGVKSMLHRHCGRHKNVAKLKSEHAQWLTNDIAPFRGMENLEGSTIKETVQLVNKAEERERSRRLSIPFSADESETDLDISIQSGQLSDVHQELLHLFAIHDAKYLMECERERRNVETTKNHLHEEMMSNMARRKARQEFELERERKIKEMKMLTDAVSEKGLAMAETNDKLSSVHADLKNAFEMMRDARDTKERNQREAAEDVKEMMLQEIRRRPARSQSDTMEQERERRMEMYQQKMNERRSSGDSLLEVQEQLLRIFGKLKREKKVKKAEIQQNQANFKDRMQEELVRKSLQKEVSRQEAQEKTRRILETKSQITEGDDAKAKAIDMLIDVQKQLLDVFAISKVNNLKHRMDHVKHMNYRANMLSEIRSRKLDRDSSSGLMRRPNVAVAMPGRRLSIIGERLQLEVGHAAHASQETINE